MCNPCKSSHKLCNADNDIGWEDMCMMGKDEEGDHNLAGGDATAS